MADGPAFFTNTRSPEDLPGMMAVIHDGMTYVPRITHAEVGHLNRPITTRLRPHEHAVYHFVLVTDGRGHFLINNELVPTSKGMLFVVSPMVRHCFGNEMGEDTEYAEITFVMLDSNERPLSISFADMMSSWLKRPCMSTTCVQAPESLQEEIYGEVESIARGGGIHDPDDEVWINAGLVRVLLQLYRHMFRLNEGEDASDLKRVRDHLHDNYASRLSLEQLADIAYLSPNYLSRRFKRLYGMTPINYQIRLRIAAACELLKTTEDPVKSVAQRTGFQNQYYFSRMFKNIVGVPPGRYRRETSA